MNQTVLAAVPVAELADAPLARPEASSQSPGGVRQIQPPGHGATQSPGSGENSQLEIAHLRAEIETHKTARRALEFELLELRRSARDSGELARQLKGTISFQIGSAMVEAAQSVSGALRLPQNLYSVYRASRALKKRRRRARQPGGAPPALDPAVVAALSEAAFVATSAGHEAAAAQARAKLLPRHVLARVLAGIAAETPPGAHAAAAALSAEALALDPQQASAKWMAFTLFDRGHPTLAAGLLDEIRKSNVAFNATDLRRAEKIRAHARLASNLGTFSAPAVIAVQPPGRRIVFVAGDADLNASRRILERARLAASLGWDAVVLAPDAGGSLWSETAGVSCRHLPRLDIDRDSVDRHLPAAAEAMARTIATIGGGIVHADARGAPALIAALAAEQAGCPLVLDLRELVDPLHPFAGGDVDSETFRTGLHLTIAAAQRAQRCLVGTRLLHEALAGGGVANERIELLPDMFAPAPDSLPRDAALARELGLDGAQVFGYVGSLHAMAGLETLVDLLDSLRDSHPALRLLLAGDGRAARPLRDIIATRQLSGRVAIAENIPFERIAAYQSLLDVAAFPLAADIQTALLSPRDIAGALCHGRAVVASRSRNAQELIVDGVTGLLRPPGRHGGFADAVATLLDDAGLRARLGRAAWTEFAVKTSPAAIGAQLDRTYGALF